MEVTNRQNLPLHRDLDLESRSPLSETDKSDKGCAAWNRAWARPAAFFTLVLVITFAATAAISSAMGNLGTDSASQSTRNLLNTEDEREIPDDPRQHAPILKRLNKKITALEHEVAQLHHSFKKMASKRGIFKKQSWQQQQEVEQLQQLQQVEQVEQPQPQLPQQQQQSSDEETTCVKAHLNSVVVINPNTVTATPVNFEGLQQYVVFPKNDEFVGADMLRARAPFQSDLLTKMVRFIRKGSTVLDIGGNLGSYTIWFAQYAGPKGTVWAFEPQTIMFQTLCANVVNNGHRNVKPLHMALSFKEGIAHMGDTLPDGASAHQSYEAIADDVSRPLNYGGRSLGQGGEAVRMTTLDALNITDISFMKIDVQGAEPLVVYGAMETIKREKPVVNFEVGTGFTVNSEMISDLAIPPKVASFNIVEFLVSLDYRLVEVQHEDQFWAPEGYSGLGGSWEDGVLSLREWNTRGARGGKSSLAL